MKNVLFLQSAIADPFAIYMQQQNQAPVYRDAHNNMWAVYSYAACKTVLSSGHACIPPLPVVNDATVSLIRSHLARLSNPPQHGPARTIAKQLYAQLQPVPIPALLQTLLAQQTTTDWVNTVCRQLPVLYLLKGFGFNAADSTYILENMPVLTQLMQPAPDMEQLPTVADKVYAIIARHIASDATAVCNLAGLFIQAYVQDAVY